MLKATASLLIIVFLFPLLVYGEGPQSQVNAPAAQEWDKFASRECSFSALFPSKPEEKEIKGQVTTHVFASSNGPDRYIVKCAKYQVKLEDPLKVQELLDSIRSQLVGSTGGRILEERRIAFSGFRGREMKLELTDFYITVRIVWVKQWLYQLFTEIPITASRSEDRQKFFDSFALDGFPKSLVAETNDDSSSQPRKMSEGVIKGKAIKLVTPAYPMVRGTSPNQRITVNILIDERVHVISAYADSGDPIFVRATVDAAKASLFAPTLFGGVAVKVQGVLTYDFTR
jgi:hypothetical protein